MLAIVSVSSRHSYTGAEYKLTSKHSMSGAMLILLAACRVPCLRELIGPEVFQAGDHVYYLFQNWQLLAAVPISPTIDQSMHIIREASSLIKETYYSESLVGNR